MDFFFFFQAEDGIRDWSTGVQTCALPIYVAELQGRVALDAARAVYNAFGGEPLAGSGLVTPFDATFIGGYSQGDRKSVV